MILRLTFVIIMLCHIPYIFFSGKESFLVIVDELNRRQISINLDYSIHGIENTTGEVESFLEIMSFKSMKNWIYYSGTIFLYFVCLAGGLMIKDLGKVFEIIAALTMSNINFICPGFFFLLACKKFYKEKSESKRFPLKIIALT